MNRLLLAIFVFSFDIRPPPEFLNSADRRWLANVLSRSSASLARATAGVTSLKAGYRRPMFGHEIQVAPVQLSTLGVPYGRPAGFMRRNGRHPRMRPGSSGPQRAWNMRAPGSLFPASGCLDMMCATPG